MAETDASPRPAEAADPPPELSRPSANGLSTPAGSSSDQPADPAVPTTAGNGPSTPAGSSSDQPADPAVPTTAGKANGTDGASGTAGVGADRTRPNPTVANAFQDAVHIDRAYFGVAQDAAVEQRRPQPTTGVIPRAEVQAAIERIVRPAPFTTAATQLRERHAVILEGAPGCGRFTGALALLTEVSSGDVHRLDPTLTLKDLYERDYDAGQAYLVLDHVAEIAPDDAEYAWSTTRSKVTKAGAYLVVTRTRVGARIDRISWERPDPALVLGRLLAGSDPPDGLVSNVTDRLPEDWTLTGIAQCANRLRDAPDDVHHALDAFDLTARQEVGDWFERSRTRTELVEMTTLAFLRGTSERRFERFSRSLEAFVAVRLPVPEPPEGEPSPGPALPVGRRGRTDALIKRVLDTAQLPRRTLDFPSDQHWAAVIGELQYLLEAPFWASVRDWIIDVLRNDVQDTEFTAIARALAALASWDAEEAVSILDLLAEDVAGPTGRGCAVAAVGLMSTDKALAPLALTIAVRWLNARSRWYRLCAGAAFIDELGMAYPAEAARRLWQLIAQDHELSAEAVSAPAWLFGALVARRGDPSPVLDLVVEKLEKFAPPRAEPRLVSLALDLALWLLYIADAKTDRCRALEYVAEHPEDAEQVARIWAALLCNRRSRLAAFDALWEAMRHSPDLATEGPLLGAALAQALPAIEHDAFIRDLRTVEARRRRRADAPTVSLADTIIIALQERYRPAANGK